MGLVHNERTKLAGTALSNLGVAIVVTGLVGPAIGIVYGTVAPGSFYWPLFGIVWLLAGFGLHVMGQVVLGRLKP